ncbi:Crp/Fnr family transcriptional regulator [Streptomyces ochraceiscleroticus]|uniref:Crp/Fnr family transcriptional regulator n=1 Tax=Streptomyces ochraceiscleroticus TaxID=47761 RepID=A0ABW1MF92_9ACTN|nr:Crp/Fnr family transcriptional regulator [Streptomyces ochraceiscleroticus]
MAGNAPPDSRQDGALEDNRLLAALPKRELERLRSGLEPVELKLSDVLYRPGERIEALWFPVRGVVSLLAELDGSDAQPDGSGPESGGAGPGPDGSGAEPGATSVEVATVGDEGVVGLPVFLGVGIPTERAMCQVAGWALRMDADRFRHEIAVVDGAFQQVLHRYTQTMFTQLARNAACNRSHRTRERCARWLLMTADRMHSDEFVLTQEFLARMLTVRRSSVSEVAGALAEEGCIRYRRGTITVLDRPGLEARACSCYRALREVTDAAFPR